jgi:hypothetical protein
MSSCDNKGTDLACSLHFSRFMQLDLGRLELSNRFEWRGGGQNEPSAVRLDVMQIQVKLARLV